ncbi:MAG: c-type cytochrome [Candidatus Kapabacteria bacterium]|nr:c-type cytochrome [Candidatus Kapabacteria bacterium]
MKRNLYLVSLILIMYIFNSGCGDKKAAVNPSELLTQAKTFFAPLPAKMPGAENDSPELIALGKKLYFETHLSFNNSQSCNSCHNIENGAAGVDNKQFSIGADGGKGGRNSPTVLNAGFQFVQFWDGRAKDLFEQAKGPILNPKEMGLKSDKDAEKAISGFSEYKNMFLKAFPADNGAITFDNIAMAIAAFERTLISKSRFDNFLSGNVTTLNEAELAGLKAFMAAGCNACHQGAMIGGNMYQKMGLLKPYQNTKDLGRFEVTKLESDKFIFKVPTLRNIDRTSPYFHDGSVASLYDAVKMMGSLELGKELLPEDILSIVIFLKALNDKDATK